MPWELSWAWSLLLIVLTVAVQVFVLGYTAKTVVIKQQNPVEEKKFLTTFCTVVGSTTLVATILLGIHAVAWACLYLVLGALPDASSAILYSLSALTSYGHAEVYLERRWQLMGALEAVNGVLLFGLTTAFLFATIQAVWPFRRGQ